MDLQLHHDLIVQSIHRRRVGVSWSISETTNVHRHGSHQRHVRVGLHQISQVRCLFAVLRDQGPQLGRAVFGDLRPHFERAKTARELGAIFDGPRVARSESPFGAFEVFGPLRKRAPVLHLAAHEHKAGVVVHVEPFVKIEGQRIGPAQTGETWAQGFAEHPQSPKCTVHVQPELLGLGQVG